MMSEVDLWLQELRANLEVALADAAVVQKLDYLDRGIGTKTNDAVWLRLREQYQQLCKLLAEPDSENA